MNWDDAQAYVRWLRSETGNQYRLPSESEWEYAARAGTTARWYWGERRQDRCEYANGPDSDDRCDDGWDRTAPVGSFRPNRFALHDMAGNVWEWTADCLHENYARAPLDGSPWTSGGNCRWRMRRGGSWVLYRNPTLRSANRGASSAERRTTENGFRVAMTLD